MADSEGAIAPAEPASESPPPATWRIGRFAIAGSMLVSATLHLLLIGPIVILTSSLLQSDPAQSVSVDLITPQELAALSKDAAEPDAPDTPKPAQPPAAPAQSPDSISPVPPAASAASPFATPLLPPPPRPAPDSAALLTKLAGALPAPDQDGGASDIQANLKADDIKAFALHVQSCWAAPPGVDKDAFAIVRVSLARDGSLSAEPSMLGGPPGTRATIMMALALAESAKRALHKCLPYGRLPPAKYDEWRLLDLRFTPRGVATASTASTVERGPRGPG
jgi:hypothetical protein